MSDPLFTSRSSPLTGRHNCEERSLFLKAQVKAAEKARVRKTDGHQDYVHWLWRILTLVCIVNVVALMENEINHEIMKKYECRDSVEERQG